MCITPGHVIGQIGHGDFLAAFFAIRHFVLFQVTGESFLNHHFIANLAFLFRSIFVVSFHVNFIARFRDFFVAFIAFYGRYDRPVDQHVLAEHILEEDLSALAASGRRPVRRMRPHVPI